jgi:hypothetical protein
MMMPAGAMTVMMVTAPAVCAALGLKGDLDLHEIGSETLQHFFNHVVGPNTEGPFANLCREMAISKMPGESHQLMAVFMPDFNEGLRSGPHLQPPPVLQLQAISVGHRDGFRQIEKDILSLVGSQSNAAAVTGIKIESESA